MELLSMYLENYRRFVKPTTIEFATNQNNVTIIRAENGAGKTGILMALLFGLFGTVKYEQFQIQGDNDYMVGGHLLTNNKTATCTVSVEFLEEGAKYKIIRTITASNVNGHIQQNNDHATAKLLKDGIDTGFSSTEINHFMNALIGENIRGFLFFDGVKYTDLFRQNDRNTKKELQRIIEKMLNINDLDATIKALSFLASQISNGGKVSNKTSTGIAQVKSEIDGLEKRIAQKEDEQENAKKTFDNLQKNYQEWIEKSKGLEQYKDIAQQITGIDNGLTAQQAALDGYYVALQNASTDFLLSAVYSSFGPEAKLELEKLSIDAKGGADLVRMILDSGRCICCDNPLTQEQREHLQSYLSAISVDQGVPFELSNRCKAVVHEISSPVRDSGFEGVIEKIIESIKTINKLQNNKANLESSLPPDQNLDEIIHDIAESATQQGGINTLMLAKKSEIENTDKELLRLNTELVGKRKRLQELEDEAAVEAGMQEQHEFYITTKAKLSKLKERYLKDAQEDISKRANDYFLQLLSEDDRLSMNRLELDEDYSIRVYNQHGQEIFQNISAGQKLLASMAFVMGLTAAASDAKPTCNFPLVMDTPLSNLDLKNRRSLIALMPKVVKQWIITPIDTELTNSEIGFFCEDNRVGKVYRLQKNGATTELVPLTDIHKLMR